MSLTPPSDPPAPADPSQGSLALFAVGPDVSTGPRTARRVRGVGEPAPAADPDPGRQLSLFGVEAVEPSAADLAGLLAGPGQVVRMGGTARVSIVVDAAWRVHVLVAELARRGLAASWVTTVEEPYAVRTSYTTALAALGRDWTRGPGKLPPAPLHLDGPRLRLWAAAAGSPDPAEGFLLRLGRADGGCWPQVGAALAAIGVAADLVGPEDGGPAYRITGRRRLARLAELVGERPAAAPPAGWPGKDMAALPPAPARPAPPDVPVDPAAPGDPVSADAPDDPAGPDDPAAARDTTRPGPDPALSGDLDAELPDAEVAEVTGADGPGLPSSGSLADFDE